MELLDFAEEARGGATAILPDVCRELVQFNSLRAYKSLELRVLLLQSIIVRKKLPSFFTKLVNLCGEELGSLLFGILLKV